MKPYCVWDVETTTKKVNKRKASPFGGVNWVVASGWHNLAKACRSWAYFGRERPHAGWFVPMLEGHKLLVGFNIKFDLLHALQCPVNRAAWIEWVADGGTVFDVQQAEYLIRAMEPSSHMLSLNEVAATYGAEQKIDAVKALWDSGVETYDIDYDLLIDYLMGEEREGARTGGDIGNTEMCFLRQWQILKERDQLNSAMLNMGALLFSTEAEFNGMYVDEPLAEQLREETFAELVDIKADLATYVQDTPFEFSWTSRTQVSALVFGGTVKYSKKLPMFDDDMQPVYFQKEEEHVLMKDGTTKPTADVTDWEWGTSVLRFASGKNAGCPKTRKVKVPDIERGQKTRVTELYHEMPGFTEPSAQWKTKVEGVYSTSGEVIKALGNRDVPFLKSLAKHTALTKDLGTYYWTQDDDGNRTGMLTLVIASIIHHSLNHCSTVTARLSSSDPNLQNIPKGDKSKVKQIFTSRYGGFIIQSDFTALEIYVQAILTKSKRLIEDLLAGLDMHCARVESAWGKELGKTYAEILAAAKDENHPEHEKYAKLRSKAKNFSFQRAYGAGAAAIAASTGMPIEDVELLIAAEAERYPELDVYYARITAKIEASRKPGPFVTHSLNKNVTCNLGTGWYATPDGKRYSYREYEAPEYKLRRGVTQTFMPTEIKNYVVQGTGGEWAKAAMWLAVRAFYHFRNFVEYGGALLVNQVHDAVYADSHENAAMRASALLEACMLEASTLMEYWFGWTLPLGVPTETKLGRSMAEEKSPAFDGYAQLVKEFRSLVRTRYINNHTPSFTNI